MNRPASFQTAGNVLGTWRESVLTGQGPTLYTCGAGALAGVELGPGRVVLIGGLPGGGKTALTMQLVIDALRSDAALTAAVCSVEMSPAVLLDRQLARLSGVPLTLIAKRRLTTEHADRIDAALHTLESVADRLAFVSAPFTLDNVAATADEFGASLLLLDYLQRIRPPGEHADRRGSVDALMDYLRQFADAGCAVLAVSAVARSRDQRGRSTYDGATLSLASFRESSELEYGADTAYVLVPDATGDAVTVRCLKHRHGEPADIVLRFDKALQRFESSGREAVAPPGAAKPKLTTAMQALWNRTPAADDTEGGDA